MELIKPKKLKQGDTIGIVAPSSWIDPVYLEKCVTSLKDYGFKVFVHPQCLLPTSGRSAGTTAEKISALHEVFINPEIDAVLCSQGGREATYLLDKIEYKIIQDNPKIFAGFSDTTPLLTTITKKTGLVSFHGPHLAYFGWEDAKQSTEQLISFLSGNWEGNLLQHGNRTEVMKPGSAEGVLIGGNFPMLSGFLLEGNFVPDLEGSILVFEAIGGEIADIDQWLSLLKISGVFDKVAGVIFGQFTNILDTPNSLGRRFDIDLKDVLYRNVENVRGPVIFNAPIGHEHPNITWPLGIKATLNTKKNISLILNESPFIDA